MYLSSIKTLKNHVMKYARCRTAQNEAVLEAGFESVWCANDVLCKTSKQTHVTTICSASPIFPT